MSPHCADEVKYGVVDKIIELYKERAAKGEKIAGQKVRELIDVNGIRVVLDATRAVENAFFIREREAGYEQRTIAEILLEMCSYTDACTMSGARQLGSTVRTIMRTGPTPATRAGTAVMSTVEG